MTAALGQTPKADGALEQMPTRMEIKRRLYERQDLKTNTQSNERIMTAGSAC